MPDETGLWASGSVARLEAWHKFIAADTEKWAKVVKFSGAKPD